MPLTQQDFDILTQGRNFWLATNHFQKHINMVVSYLNNSSPVSDLQQCRNALLGTHRPSEPFLSYEIVKIRDYKRFDQYPDHWYHYNDDGMDEMQFNFGMSGGDFNYYRIGLGFNFEDSYGTSNLQIYDHLHAFQAIVAANRAAFQGLIQRLGLRLEVDPANNDPFWMIDQILHNPHSGGLWLFIGRILHISNPQDAVILGRDSLLLQEFNRVYGAFVPYWCQVMSRVHRRPVTGVRMCTFCIQSYYPIS